MNQNNTVIGAYQRHSFDDEDAFVSVNEAMPKATGHDLLVKVAAVSVNPVDVGVYAGIRRELKAPKVLGWDAVGTVEYIGNSVSLFKVGIVCFTRVTLDEPGAIRIINSWMSESLGTHLKASLMNSWRACRLLLSLRMKHCSKNATINGPRGKPS